MINIIETKPIKMTGRTSFLVSSLDYNVSVNIEKVLNEITKPIWHKKSLVFEIPATALAETLDRLTYLDDITLRLLPDNKQKREPGKLTVDYKTTPFEHQKEAIKFGLENDKWLLLDSPGLGKTCSIIHLAEELRHQRGVEHCLIICGIAGLRANWEKEIKLHSDLDFITIGKKINRNEKVNWAKIPERADQLKNKIDEFFVIINVEMLVDDRVIDAINNSVNEFDMIVVDEVHKCLHKDTLISTNIGDLKISDIVDNKIKCKVKSYNTKTNKIEYQDILDYYNNGYSDQLLRLTFIDSSGNKISIECTPDHKIYTQNRGYVRAGDLVDSDDIILLN